MTQAAIAKLNANLVEGLLVDDPMMKNNSILGDMGWNVTSCTLFLELNDAGTSTK